MLEFLLCLMVTIFPDYLFRRFFQGKRLGNEINLYSVWYELRWGITACILLTVSLITMIFYYHPSTTNVTKAFRTITIQPEMIGRVEEVYVTRFQHVEAGQALFRMEDSRQAAALDTAEKSLAELEASAKVSQTELEGIDGRIAQARAAHDLAWDDLQTYQELRNRNASTTTRTELNRLQAVVDARVGELDAALASKRTLQTKLGSLLPAELESAKAKIREAQVAVDRTTVYAGVAGTLQQFTLRPGEVINPLMRPAGILVPDDAGDETLVVGFNQVEAQVLKPGMIAEVTCASKPYQIIPMVLTEVQDVIASGQVRASDQLVDAQQLAKPGTITATLEPLYAGQIADIPRGSSCIANAYTNNHDRLSDPNTGPGQAIFLHAVDATAMVHAMLLRIQAVALPVKTLVLSGH
ncbi:HlyD family secretion protein [Paracoccus aminophilus]|uniref:Multidrug resistance efflux pump n=1 Tax=Paracoccus aminophilus JCM 7686 TaxID=1367847 RepID=S5XPU1_PARAH|nr:biotin/lipoyl-binding protein [Paracoccus aminophilus]AGT09364.1 multidrug resistance efflux pump [Paracoccus aminophilus JCM 7686]